MHGSIERKQQDQYSSIQHIAVESTNPGTLGGIVVVVITVVVVVEVEVEVALLLVLVCNLLFVFDDAQGTS